MISGAGAARADLARLRRGDVGPLARERLDAADSVFGAADAAFTTLRAYEEGHPAVSRCVDRLLERLRAYWGEYGDLVVTLEPTAVVLGDKIVHSSDSAQAFAWFPFYASGVRELSLRVGMPRADVCALLAVGNQYRGLREQDFAEDDVVTALWQLNLGSLEVGVAASYGEDADKARDVVKRVRDESEAAMAKFPAGASAERLLDDNDRRRWAAGLCVEDNAGFRYVEALLVALQGNPPDIIFERLCDLISLELGVAIEAGMFGVAQQILGFLDVRRDLLEKSLDGGVVLVLLETYAKTVSEAVEESVESILRRSSHHAATIVESALDMQPHKTRRLLAVAPAFGEPAAVAARGLLRRTADIHAEALVGMVGKVPGSASRDALLIATDHDFYRVRGLAYQTLFEDKSVPPDRDLILRSLDDEHSLVRQTALEYLAEAQPEGAREWLEAQAESFDFGSFDPAEQKRLYSALVAVAGKDLVPWLEVKLSKTNLKFYNSTDAERICAINALAELRSTSSLPLLEKLAKNWLSSKVREAAKRAIELLDAPPPARLVRRRTFGTTWGDAAYTSGPPVVVDINPDGVATAQAVPETTSEGSGPVAQSQGVVDQSRRMLRERSTRRTESPPIDTSKSFPFDQAASLKESTPPPIAEDESVGSGYSFVATRDSRRSRARRPTEQESSFQPAAAAGPKKPFEFPATPARVRRESVPAHIKSGDGQLGKNVYVSTRPRGKRGTRSGSDGGDPRK